MTKPFLSHTTNIPSNTTPGAISRIYDDKEFLCISKENEDEQEEDTNFKIEFENSCRHLSCMKNIISLFLFGLAKQPRTLIVMLSLMFSVALRSLKLPQNVSRSRGIFMMFRCFSLYAIVPFFYIFSILRIIKILK